MGNDHSSGHIWGVPGAAFTGSDFLRATARMEEILYCPTSCPYLGKNGCRVACGNEEIECPVMAGVLAGEKTPAAKEPKMANKITLTIR